MTHHSHYPSLLAAVCHGAHNCKTDKDCPSSYCMDDKTKQPPYQCHSCGVGCCNSDADCAGSYCMMDSTKKPPFVCHGTASGTIPGQSGILRGVPTVSIGKGVNMPIQVGYSAAGCLCGVCR